MSKIRLPGLGAQLRSARDAAGLSQSALAARAGVTRPTVAQAERGTGRLDSYLLLAAALEQSVGGHRLPPGDTLGQRLAALRMRSGISRRALAASVGIAAPTIAALEAGSAGHLAVVLGVAAALDARLSLSPCGKSGGFWETAGNSSVCHTWTTPPVLLERLYPLVGGAFDIDPCSPGAGPSAPVRARIHFTALDDGLSLPWPGRVFMNPPYGRGLPAWIAKARSEAAEGRSRPVLGLVPARCDTGWWHKDVAGHADALLLRGRLRFGGAESGAPFPSALLAWGADGGFVQGLREAFPDAQYVGRA